MSQYIVDKEGRKTHVILPIDEYEELIGIEISEEEAKELEDILDEMMGGEYVKFDPTNYKN